MIVQAMLFMIACLGLNLQLGSTGMMNLAGAAFMAFGAYTAGLMGIKCGLAFMGNFTCRRSGYQLVLNNTIRACIKNKGTLFSIGNDCIPSIWL